MATHSNILAQRIPQTEEPGELQSMGLQRVGYDQTTNTHTTKKNVKKYNIQDGRRYGGESSYVKNFQRCRTPYNRKQQQNEKASLTEERA